MKIPSDGYIEGWNEGLEYAANWHDLRATMADAMNDAGFYDKSIAHHHEREAARLRRMKLPVTTTPEK